MFSNRVYLKILFYSLLQLKNVQRDFFTFKGIDEVLKPKVSLFKV